MRAEQNVITKQQALRAYRGNASALARALEISPQAIYQWEDGPIPELHALKLRFVLCPRRKWSPRKPKGKRAVLPEQSSK